MLIGFWHENICLLESLVKKIKAKKVETIQTSSHWTLLCGGGRYANGNSFVGGADSGGGVSLKQTKTCHLAYFLFADLV